MSFEQRFDRKQFLALTLGASSSLVMGCSADPTESGSGGAGAGGAGAAGTFSTGGAAGTFSTGGVAAGAGGSGGATLGGAGTGGGGAAGMAGAGGATVAPDCAAQLKVFISANHGHMLSVSAADVMAGVSKIYDTKGISDHEHFIQLTSADFAKLQAGGSVHKLSCNGGHEHEYIVNCVGVEKPETTSGIPGFCDPDHQCASAMDKLCPELP